ncbi:MULTISPECIES: hypothetical protein [Psychrobacter]|uniref:hypothetical protein n=1 Tax=Psychrobacter TaxID=497 RepID=UPI00191A0050|nr:hypothetical protein [Psychrobacter immobilis]
MKKMKNRAIKNIKVNIYTANIDGSKTRTSTTLSYAICDFYFGNCLFPIESREILNLGKGLIEYRKWLTAKAQEWVNEQHVYSTHLTNGGSCIQAAKSKGWNSC